MNRGVTQKQYLELVPPTEEDARSSQMRILDALKEKGITASFTLPALQKLYPICDEADYNITVSLDRNKKGSKQNRKPIPEHSLKYRYQKGSIYYDGLQKQLQ